MTRRVRVEALVLLPALLVLGLLWPLARPVPGTGDTFQFWYAGHLVVTGASPYDQTAWHAAGERYGVIADNVASNCADPQAQVCVWAYPPLTAWYLAPFGALAPALGLPAFDAFVLLTLLAGAIATVTVFGPAGPAERALLLVTAAASHPFLTDIRYGHPIGVLLLAVAALASGLRSQRTGLILFGALGFAAKPHLAAALAPVVVGALAAQGRWRAISLVTATLAILFALSLVRAPEAIAVLAGSGAKTTIAWATMSDLADALGGSVLIPLVGGAAAALLAVACCAPRERPSVLIASAAAYSLAITPYAQPYDLLLTLPAFASAARAAARTVSPVREALTAAVMVAPAALSWTAVALAPSLYAALSLAALGLLVTACFARVRTEA